MTPPILSVVVPVARPALDLGPVLRGVDRALSEIGASAELIVSGRRVAGRPEDVDATPTYIAAAADGYGPALRAGLEAATGQYVMTIDPECGGIADAMHRLWDARERGEVIVGSRYVTGAEARMSLARRIGSRTVNQVFNRGLSLSVRDLSSAFRLYRADVLRDQPFAGRDYDLLPEILVRTLTGGWRVCEVPLRLDVIRRRGSVRPLLRLVRAYARTFGSLWKLRNSIQAADYDARAHDSIIPLQRYWQRTRYRHVTDLIRGHGAVLDVGCGSSKIIGALPPGSVSLDVLANKLRYARRFTTRCVRASGFHLPFADGSFRASSARR